jgi:hypothetical protein
MADTNFFFNSPKTPVPALLGTLDEIDRGSDTLKSVLVTAARTLRQPLEEFIERVL